MPMYAEYTHNNNNCYYCGSVDRNNIILSRWRCITVANNRRGERCWEIVMTLRYYERRHTTVY